MEKINQDSHINNETEANFQPPENEISKEVNKEVKQKSGTNVVMFILVALLFTLLGGLGIWFYVNEGSMCAGEAGIKCPVGFRCKMDSPNASGKWRIINDDVGKCVII